MTWRYIWILDGWPGFQWISPLALWEIVFPSARWIFSHRARRWRRGGSYGVLPLASLALAGWGFASTLQTSFSTGAAVGWYRVPCFFEQTTRNRTRSFLWNFHRFWADISWLNHCSIGSCFFRFAISENFSLCTQVDVSFFLWHVYCTYLYVYVVRPFFSSTNFRKQIRGLQIRTDTCGINRQMMTNEQISKWNWHQFDPSITEAAVLGGQKWCLTVSDRTHWGSCEVGHWMAKFSAAWDHRGTCVENGAKRRNGDGSKGQALWNSHVSKCFFLLYFPYFPYDGETQSTDWIVTHTQIFPNRSQASEQISVPLGSSNSDVPSS